MRFDLDKWLSDKLEEPDLFPFSKQTMTEAIAAAEAALLEPGPCPLGHPKVCWVEERKGMEEVPSCTAGSFEWVTIPAHCTLCDSIAHAREQGRAESLAAYIAECERHAAFCKDEAQKGGDFDYLTARWEEAIYMAERARKLLPADAQPPKCDTRDGKCEVCGEFTSTVAANPGLWPLWLPKPGGNGKMFPYHTSCIVKRVNVESRVSERTRQLETAADNLAWAAEVEIEGQRTQAFKRQHRAKVRHLIKEVRALLGNKG